MRTQIYCFSHIALNLTFNCLAINFVDVENVDMIAAYFFLLVHFTCDSKSNELKVEVDVFGTRIGLPVDR